MDKENVVWTYSEIFLILIKERNLAVCDVMDEPGGNYAEKVQKASAAWFHVYEGPEMFRFTEAENRAEVVRSKGQGEIGVFQLVKSFRYARWFTSRHLLYSRVSVVKNL